MRWFLCIALLTSRFAFAQGDFAPPPSKDDPNQIKTLKPLPANAILLPGALPKSSDEKTAVPEAGNIHKNVYENRYFGMTYTFPEEFFKEFDGPPPSETGKYVLAELGLKERGSILITAQDDFFGGAPKVNLPAYYKLEDSPAELNQFKRYDYMSPVAGLHWSVLSTSIRCHTVQFVFMSRETELLAALRDGLTQIKIAANEAPRCVANYATGDNVVFKVDPVLTDRKFNPIPVRIVIGKNGKVQHVHVVSAFASQAPVIIDALLQWRFKPQPFEIETGIYFGSPKTRSREPGAASSAAD